MIWLPKHFVALSLSGLTLEDIMFPSPARVSASVVAAFPGSLVSSVVRSSRRSASGSVVSLTFSSFGVASAVARFWSPRLPAASAPRLRRVGAAWLVSVPVAA